MPPSDPPTGDLLGYHIGLAADGVGTLWPMLRDFEERLRSLEQRANEGETLPSQTIERMLRRYADLLSERSGRLHDLARMLGR